MAYGSKYELTCTSKVYHNLYTAKIMEDGYADAVIDRDIPVNPFKLTKDSKSDAIKGTSFEFGIREKVDFEFIPLFTSVPKKYLIKLYKGVTQIWTGFLNTQQYLSDYKSVPNTLWFSAVDGLGMLKDQEFTLTGWQSEFAIIRYCMAYCNDVMNLDYAIAIAIHDVNHNAAISPLEQTYHNCEIFAGLNCYEIIEKILTRYDAEITQLNNRWLIRSSKDKMAGRLIYDWEGTYSASQQPPDIQNFDYPVNSGDCWPVGNPLRHSLKSGGRQIRIQHNYGLRESMLRNHDFSKWAWVNSGDHSEGADLEEWSETDPFGTMTVYPRTDKSGEPYVYLYGNANSTESAGLNQSLKVTNLTNCKFIFEVESCAVYNTGTSGNVKMIVTLVTSGGTYYLSTSGWTATPTTISISNDTVEVWDDNINWQKLKIITDEIPDDGLLSVSLLQMHDATLSGVHFKNPKAYFLQANTYYSWSYEEETDLTAVFDNSSEMIALPDTDIISADAPSIANNLMMYDKISLYYLSATFYNSLVTTFWKFDDNDTLYTLLQLYLKLLASRNFTPRQTLTGTLRGERLTFDCLIEHVYNSSRQFEIEKGEWDMYNETWNVTLLEVPVFADKDITLSDGTTLGSAANLTVATVTPDGYAKSTSTAFNTTVHIDNTGEMTGQGSINWKIVNGADATQSSGNHASGNIAGAADENHVIAMTTPGSAGTYYVKCKMALDTEWVTSSAITVS